MVASLIGGAIKKFDFKRSQLKHCKNSICRTFLEVNKLFATDLPYLHLVIICFKLRSLLMATLKTVLRALCSYEKKRLV